MRNVLHTYYGVPDDLQVWANILGFIGSVPAQTIRRSYGYFANVGKRSLINKAIKEEQKKTIEAYQTILKEVASKTAEALKRDEESDHVHSDAPAGGPTTGMAVGNA